MVITIRHSSCDADANRRCILCHRTAQQELVGCTNGSGQLVEVPASAWQAQLSGANQIQPERYQQYLSYRSQLPNLILQYILKRQGFGYQQDQFVFDLVKFDRVNNTVLPSLPNLPQS